MKQKFEKHKLSVPHAVGDIYSSICEAGAQRHSMLWLRANQAAIAAMFGAGAHTHLAAMKLAIATAVLRVLDIARPGFQATHKHAEGGLYQVLGEVKMHADENTWVTGVRYRNENGEEFVRKKSSFDKRMT